MLKLIERYGDRFRIAYQISGVLLEQLAKDFPEVIASFQELVDTGCVEMLSGTYHQSPSFLFDREVFFNDVVLHRQKIWEYFRQNPRVFANAGLLYGNHMGYFARRMGMDAVICEGLPASYRDRNPNHVFHATDTPELKLLPRNQSLSEDLGYRFADSGWEHFPLHADTYANWLSGSGGEVQTLVLEYESLGYYQPQASGIFDFWDRFVEVMLAHHEADFLTPSEAIGRYPARGSYNVEGFRATEVAGLHLEPGKEDPLQAEALRKVHELTGVVMQSQRADLIQTWSRLQTLDYFSGMQRDKKHTLGQVGRDGAFNSPYDAYIYFINAISDFQLQIKKAGS